MTNRISCIIPKIVVAMLAASLPSRAWCASVDADLNWCTVDGGAATLTGGAFSLSGTIGQPDAGVALNGGTLTLIGGFWPGPTALACLADVTGNHVVDIDDLVMVITQWGACPSPPAPCSADVAPPNGNGQVNIDDLVVIITSWGNCQ